MTTTDDPNWHSSVEAALIADDMTAIDWDETADLVVVGFGGAGVAAALQARELGLSVVAVDRFHGGGSTQASGGVYYAGGGTAIQRAAGVDDTSDNMQTYLRQETGSIVSDETLARFCAESAESVDWLMRHGVDFRPTYWRGKTSYPPAAYHLYHPDNSLVASYRHKAKPAARGHRGFVPNQGTAAQNLGGSIYLPLKAAALSHGVRLIEQAEARQLVVDRCGRVLGVKVLQLQAGSEAARFHQHYYARARAIMAAVPSIIPGSALILKLAQRYLAKAAHIEATQRVTRFIGARRGVCLSTGSFIMNRGMVAAYAPRYLSAMPMGTAGDDGAGIRLGQTAGGSIANMGRISPWRFINPPIAWAQGIVVNARGERFADETLYGATLGVILGETQDGKGTLILDARLARNALEQVSGGKVLAFQRDLTRLNMWFAAKKAPSIEKLARKIGLDPARLAASVAAYNRAARGETRCPYEKSRDDMRELLEPPFYAIDVSIGARLFPCPSLTLGGLAVDEETGQVRREGGGTIEGLYAAGRTAVGICSHNYVSGLSIADCVFSGRRAARHAAGTSTTKVAAAEAADECAIRSS